MNNKYFYIIINANYFLPLFSHCCTARVARLGKFDFLLLTLLAESGSRDFGCLEMPLWITWPSTLGPCLSLDGSEKLLGFARNPCWGFESKKECWKMSTFYIYSIYRFIELPTDIKLPEMQRDFFFLWRGFIPKQQWTIPYYVLYITYM